MKAAENNRQTEKMKAERHQAWVESLATTKETSRGVVIKMPVPRWGKTARGLSGREIEVLQLVSFGRTSKEIADELCLSAHTVVNHRKNMLTRSRCKNLAELVRVAIRENLL